MTRGISVFLCALFSAAVAVAITPQEAESLIEQVEDVHFFRDFEGQNGFLKAASPDTLPIKVATGFPLDMDSDVLFSESYVDGEWTQYLAAIGSADAEAVRLCLNLNELAAGDEVWVIDPSGPAAHGPYTSLDAVPGGRWLPTIFSDMAILVLRTEAAARPRLTLEGLSHFYWAVDPAKASMECHINIVCANPELQDVGSGVGFMVVPSGGQDFAVCSGTLVENAPDNPYFITANHCVPGSVDAWNIDVIWDYRAATCGAEDIPDLASLPRSTGVILLETDDDIDASLMLLDEVESTRTFVPWTIRSPVPDEPTYSIHHPAGGGSIETIHMRIATGRVVESDIRCSALSLPYEHETRVVWDEGGTEGGSSGGCLLLEDGAGRYVLAGMLSGGPAHTCGEDRSGNQDCYASFRHFYLRIEGYLMGTPPDVPASAQASDGDHAGYVRITWDAVPGATGYNVYRSQDNTRERRMTKIAEGITSTSYDDYTATDPVGCIGENSGTYYYWVQARNGDGVSGLTPAGAGYPGKAAARISSVVPRQWPSADTLLLGIAGIAMAAMGRRRTGNRSSM